ncbi:hypothetical protein [Archaeoglobus fulgidus]|uniref:Uncharacterized protein AF_1629 n=3 Tax=Archaeoglobus fulgidus TaxID=2234 RepID=Y1629_ARCFU|nr:hypothetical protein [Archaeoglobus fulgidus]O28644.1 RecName: Full=Uncharacterized protein AF_1629 [Archaeoglobus fulgidus DSM 4304]AAB89626.1 predicted coding region AF_1629 [Archaeoglobus fulgidus DSM 4304]AIG98633.1 hypothetical protein AFULGI_00018800 [Archaeoglobus fulgidus DSM 8774]KUJ93028.1 MAG: hypothetical protein XD40_1796 [Archaeoglobus fulgidus]KUK05448.1 MAG: Uncharacterized protein XD48_2321 [Archaeoglobus fulgidus]
MTVDKKELNVAISGIGNFKTYAIVFKPNYLYSTSPSLIYEHSAVLKMQNSAIVVDSDQSTFSSEKISIYLINATFNPFSTTENVNLIFQPISYGGAIKFTGTITFECYNEQTAEWWNETLGDIYGAGNVDRDGTNVTVILNDVELSINYLIATATSSRSVRYDVDLEPKHLKPLLNDSATYQLSAGSVKDFGVLVLDEYLNPIRNKAKLASVSINPDCGSCNKYLNSNGEVWCSFTPFPPRRSCASP